MALFFTDVDEALSRRASLGVERLKEGKGEESGMDVIPVPLGDAFTLASGATQVSLGKRASGWRATQWSGAQTC